MDDEQAARAHVKRRTHNNVLAKAGVNPLAILDGGSSRTAYNMVLAKAVSQFHFEQNTKMLLPSPILFRCRPLGGSIRKPEKIK